MNRRRFLKLAAGSTPFIAGCASQPGQQIVTETPTDVHTTTVRSTGESSKSAGSNTIFVGPDGHDQNSGDRDEPLGPIQKAVNLAEPGDIVHVLPGEYYESIQTKRPGDPDAPITMTGPCDAILHGDNAAEWTGGIDIWHSHIHIRGLTIDGLQKPSEPNDPASYMQSAIRTLPVNHLYLNDLVIKPHAVGNARFHFISLDYVEGADVGEFRVIGPAGLEYELTDEFGHNAEVVYVGNPLDFEYNGWDLVGRGELGEMDETNNVHVHHIDNSAGHPHAELVDAKAGTSDILIEYCTDAGGAGAYPLTDHHSETSEAAISLTGTNSILR